MKIKALKEILINKTISKVELDIESDEGLIINFTDNSKLSIGYNDNEGVTQYNHETVDYEEEDNLDNDPLYNT